MYTRTHTQTHLLCCASSMCPWVNWQFQWNHQIELIWTSSLGFILSLLKSKTTWNGLFNLTLTPNQTQNMQFGLGNDLSVYTSPVGTPFFFNQEISGTLFVLCYLTLLLYRKEFVFLTGQVPFQTHSSSSFLFSPFCDPCVLLCFCGLSTSASSVPGVTQCQHSFTEVLPLTPATQTHTSKYTHTQVERWWGAKIQHTYSRFMLFIFSFPLFHTHSLTAIVCLLHFFIHAQIYPSHLNLKVRSPLHSWSELPQAEFPKASHVNYNHRT